MKLALVLLAALASPAFADQPRVCTCATSRTLPATGAVDVPTNAHFWRVPSTEPGREIQPYALAAHTGYVLQDTSFTTGTDVDHDPPLPPTLAAASITLAGMPKAERAPVSILHLTVQASADTAVLRIDFIDALGEVTYYTTPEQLSLCDPGIALTPGHVRVTITAYHLAGNPSSSDWLDTHASIEQSTKPRCGKSVAVHAGRFSDSDTILVFGLGLAGVGLLLYRAHMHGRARRRTAREPFALPAAEQLARSLRRRCLATIALAGLVTSVALNDSVFAMYAAALTPLGAVLVLDAVTTYVGAGRLLALLRFDGATATVQHDEVVALVGKAVTAVHASPRLVERARHHGIPTATL